MSDLGPLDHRNLGLSDPELETKTTRGRQVDMFEELERPGVKGSTILTDS